jgi:hypothetical protein
MNISNRWWLVVVSLLALASAPTCSRYATGHGPEDGGDQDAGGQTDGDPGGGEDGGSPAEGGDLGDRDCVVPDPLPVHLQIGEETCWDCYEAVSGEALVIYKGRPQNQYTSEVWLLFTGDDRLMKVFSELPDGYEIPVELGQVVWARLYVDTPWWINQEMDIATLEQLPLIAQASRDYWVEDPVFRCPPEEGACGLEGHPTIEMLGEKLEQGGSAVVDEAGATFKIFIGTLYQYLTMDCVDFPAGWLDFAMLNNANVSQCSCQDDHDCARDELCDTYAHRCVANRCLDIDCAPGNLCDPYRGECVEAPRDPCRGDGDCPGSMQVCNPKTGVCQDDWCQLVDCAPCSPLVGDCYQCLEDCDCAMGVCAEEQRMCVPGCVEDKLSLTRENPQSFELYYACFRNVLDDPLDLLGRIDPSIACNHTDPNNACQPEAEVVCFAPLEYRPNSREISEAGWHRICGLSRHPLVSRIVGGYYLP